MIQVVLIITGFIVLFYFLGLFSVKKIYTEIGIKASPDIVWKHLTTFENYKQWNPFIKNLSGELIVGSKLRATIQQPGKNPMDFRPTVLVAKKNKEFRWIGRLILPGLFDGEHYFIIEENSAGKVKFKQGEHFRGILALLMWGAVESGTTQGFKDMNNALKSLAEKSNR